MRKIPSFVWLMASEIIIGAILLTCGFKFTYAPELENSWNAISAFASWAGVIASSVAIFVAVQIPRKIAEQQNKVALFDKRFYFYEIISRCCTFRKAIKNANDLDRINSHFLLAFENDSTLEISEENVYNEIIRILHCVLLSLRTGNALFPFEMEKELEAICNSLILLIGKSRTEADIKNNYSQFSQAMTYFEEKFLPLVKESLAVGK